jgi:cytochrome c oxidase accessory protein FixG
MFDEDTLIVTYEKWRGEPRGKHIKKKKDEPNAGHCIDCNQCVAVCPMGIDIRDGVQLECIGCALCIDACNNVMEKVGLPGNLITYDTERRQALRAKGEDMRYRLLRPRTVLYAMLILGVAGLMFYSLLSRSEQEINVLHDRAPLFVRLSDGSIRNGYEIKILNKVREERRFILTMEGLEGATMNLVGREGGGLQGVILSAQPDTVSSYRVYIRLPAERLTGERMDFRFVLTERSTGERAERETVFRGPAR